MLILTIRTDKPEAEIGLYDSEKQLAYDTWQAHRQLAETILQKIDQILNAQGRTLSTAEGIVCFQGPGSFTGLRIGLTVGNSLAYSYKLPIVGAQGSDWQKTGIQRLQTGENDGQVLPFYGADAHITLPKK